MTEPKEPQAQKDAPDGQLGDWLDKVPKGLQDKVDEYVRLKRLKNRAADKENIAKEVCITAMQKSGIKRVRIDEGEKWLVCQSSDSLKTEAVRKTQFTTDDDE